MARTYPYIAWTFGVKLCEVVPVRLVEASRFGIRDLDAAGNAYDIDKLFSTQRAAIHAAGAYLDRKQLEVDKQQRLITSRREFLKRQLSVIR